MLNGLDLFSGIGGNSIALRDYVRTIAYCEADRHAQAVLLSRMVDGSLRPAPIWDDVTSLGGWIIRGARGWTELNALGMQWYPLKRKKPSKG